MAADIAASGTAAVVAGMVADTAAAAGMGVDTAVAVDIAVAAGIAVVVAAAGVDPTGHRMT